MTNFLTGFLGALIGWAIVTALMLHKDWRKRKADDAAFAEMERHTKGAMDAMRAHNDEAYEFHMKQAVAYFDRKYGK